MKFKGMELRPIYAIIWTLLLCPFLYFFKVGYWFFLLLATGKNYWEDIS